MPNRDNGFVARHYVPLADLDPRLADAMLDLLRDEGIAAYASPSTGRLGGYLEVILPERPRDRLWVDREQRERAAGLLNEHTDPGSIGRIPADTDAARATEGSDPADAVAAGDLLDKPVSPAAPLATTPAPAAADSSAGPDSAAGPADAGGSAEQHSPADPVDSDSPADAPRPAAAHRASPPSGTDGADGDLAWAAVLASFELPAYEPPSAASEGSGDGTGTTRTADHPVPRRVVRPAEPSATPVLETPAATPSPADLPVTSGWDPLDLLDEHFVPPQPPAPPRLQTHTRWALAAIIGGLALIVWPHLSDSMPEGAAALGVFLMIGGLVALVVNMRDDHGDDRDDDGAVV